MIDPKELRIGNWLKANDTENNLISPGLVDTIFYRAIRMDFGSYSVQPPIENLHPIPLTPEILGKCGFGPEGDFWYKRISAQSPGKAGIRYMETRTEGGWCYLCGIDGGRIGEPIWYLHQLQNLFYCLTGRELEVKL